MMLKLFLFLCLLLQVCIWLSSNRIKPKFISTPYPPTPTQIQALSFGDIQFYYRKLGLELQNAGDKHGHYTSFLQHDYTKLKMWFETLDNIDAHSQYIPFMAAYYYAMVPEANKAKIIAQYIVEYAKQNPKQNWRLLTTAAYIYHQYPEGVMQKLKDIGNTLINIDSIPLWAKTLSVFYLKDNKDICTAYNLITKISEDDMLANAENINDQFLVRVLEQNILKLQNTSKEKLRECRY